MTILPGRAAFKTALGLSRLPPAAALALAPAAIAAGDPGGPAPDAAPLPGDPPEGGAAPACVLEGPPPPSAGGVPDALIFASARAALASAGASGLAPQLFYAEEGGAVFLFVDAGVFERYLGAVARVSPGACGVGRDLRLVERKNAAKLVLGGVFIWLRG
ncbi:hypothetical protein ACQ5SO_20255, partial [Rhodovulum sp. DZ06]|uniref:hypothetical protein n=1 Tax=Rhodovulum sp. DZ06 TaxID=3425126 RepID=UPI003D34FF92